MVYSVLACRAKLHLMTLVIVIMYYDSFNTGVSDISTVSVSACVQLCT